MADDVLFQCEVCARRRKRGRHRRALDAFAAQVREAVQAADAEALIVAARAHADLCDEVESNPDESAWTRSRCLTEYRTALAELRPYATATTSDPFDDLLAAAADAWNTPAS